MSEFDPSISRRLAYQTPSSGCGQPRSVSPIQVNGGRLPNANGGGFILKQQYPRSMSEISDSAIVVAGGEEFISPRTSTWGASQLYNLSNRSSLESRGLKPQSSQQSLRSDKSRNISAQLHSKKVQLEQKREELNCVLANTSELSHSSRGSENALESDNSFRLEKARVTLAQQRNELWKVEDAAGKSKQLQANLQAKLEIIRRQEQQFESQKGKKVREVRSEFAKHERELTDMLNDVSGQFEQFFQHLQAAEEDLNIDLETRSFLKEDLMCRLVQRAEIVGEKEELEQICESFCVQFPEEQEYLCESSRVLDQVESLSKAIQTQIAEENRLVSVMNAAEQQARTMESYEIHFASRLDALRERFEEEKRLPLEVLARAQTSLNEIASSPVFTISLPSLETLCEESRLLLTKDQWNNSGQLSSIQRLVKLFAAKTSGDGPIEGDASLEEFISEVRVKTEHCAGGKSEAIDMFIKNIFALLSNLLILEAVNEKYVVEEQRHLSEKARYEREAANLRAETSQMAKRNESIRRTREEEEGALRKAQQSYLVQQENLRIAVQLKAEKLFTLYCSEQQRYFEQLSEESGEQKVAEIKLTHREEFTRLLEEEQRNRLQRMSNVKEQRERLEELIEKNIVRVEEEIAEQVRQIDGGLADKIETVKTMREEKAELDLASDQVHQDIAKLHQRLQIKEDKIHKTLSEQFSDVIGQGAIVETQLNEEIEKFKTYLTIINDISMSILKLEAQERAFEIESQKLLGQSSSLNHPEAFFLQRQINGIEAAIQQLEEAQSCSYIDAGSSSFYGVSSHSPLSRNLSSNQLRTTMTTVDNPYHSHSPNTRRVITSTDEQQQMIAPKQKVISKTFVSGKREIGGGSVTSSSRYDDLNSSPISSRTSLVSTNIPYFAASPISNPQGRYLNTSPMHSQRESDQCSQEINSINSNFKYFPSSALLERGREITQSQQIALSPSSSSTLGGQTNYSSSSSYPQGTLQQQSATAMYHQYDPQFTGYPNE